MFDCYKPCCLFSIKICFGSSLEFESTQLSVRINSAQRSRQLRSVSYYGHRQQILLSLVFGFSGSTTDFWVSHCLGFGFGQPQSTSASVQFRDVWCKRVTVSGSVNTLFLVQFRDVWCKRVTMRCLVQKSRRCFVHSDIWEELCMGWNTEAWKKKSVKGRNNPGNPL